MKNLDKKIFDEYEKENPIPDFDKKYSGVFYDQKLDAKKSKKRRFIWIPFTVGGVLVTPVLLFGIVLGVAFLSSIKSETSMKKTMFRLNEETIRELESFYALNEVNYPSSSANKSNMNVSSTYIENMNKFVNNYFPLFMENKNTGMSPLSLYMHYDVLAEIANDEAQVLFNDVLGSSLIERQVDYRNTYYNNYFASNDGGMYMYNGLFMNQGTSLDEDTLTALTNKYVEAYAYNSNISKDVDKMLSWVNNHQPGIKLTRQDLGPAIDDNDFFLFSTLYFDNVWTIKFDLEKSYTSTFDNFDGSVSNQKYMKHTIHSTLKHFDNCISFYDYYNYGYKVQYILPSEGTSYKDVLSEDVLNFDGIFSGSETDRESTIIDLSVPKFELENTINVKDKAADTALEKFYNAKNDLFSKKIHSEGPSYLLLSKQMNKISFDEKGTKVTTVSISAGGKSSAPMTGGYIINLNEPFLYVIKDRNNTPIFIGQYIKANQL